MNRRAFSIIELIVVLGIIMILIGLALPTFAGARSSAEMVALTADMQQVSRVTELYCDAWDSSYPVADDRPDFSPLDMSREEALEIGLGRAWPNALYDAGFIDREEIRRFFNEQPIYWSVAMYIDPGKLTPQTIVPWEVLTTSAVRRAWATYPADKFLLGVSHVPIEGQLQVWNRFGQPGPKGPFAAADGSIVMIRSTELAEPDPAPIDVYGSPIMYTWNGIRGRDR